VFPASGAVSTLLEILEELGKAGYAVERVEWPVSTLLEILV
jgi:hypothetical protein